MGIPTDKPRLRRLSSARVKEDLVDFHHLPRLDVKSTYSAVPRAQVYQLPTSSLTSNHVIPSDVDAYEGYAADMINASVQDGGYLVEIGVRSVQSTTNLLQALVDQGKDVSYFVIADDESAMEPFLVELNEVFPSIECTGAAGLITESYELLPTQSHRTFVLSLAHLTRDEAADILEPFLSTYLQPDDALLLTFPKVLVDPTTLLPALEELLQPEGELEYRHAALKDDQSLFLKVKSLDQSKKDGWYLLDTILSSASINELLSPFYHAGTWQNDHNATYLVQKPLVWLGLNPPSVKATGLKHAPSLEDLENLWRSWDSANVKPANVSQAPTLLEFEQLWNAWDVLTTQMLPQDGLLDKPIALRNPFLFYLGHLPSFLDIQVSKCLELELTEPAYFAEIFERGIDPDMEDSNKCHPHSKVPDKWPSFEEIVAFRDSVRNRIRYLYNESLSLPLRRVLWMCFEHDSMHLETFLYMMVQYDRVQPPPHLIRPAFDTLATTVKAASFIPIPSGHVTLGQDDNEQVNNHPSIPYGWDNERPSRTVILDDSVLSEMQSRPVTVGEYAQFLGEFADKTDLMPASWTDDGQSVKTVFGPISIELASSWPVMVSYNQAAAYAAHYEMRLPHEAELVSMRLPGHGHNIGLNHWAPTPVEDNTKGWIAENAWEWTCDVLTAHEGFEPSELYPGYTADFFDEKHNIVVGASWATPERIATRKTFRNWYQRGYPYMFATFRCVKSTSTSN
ncbi:hypothetical protein THRCLA_05694 [Thraustotheca clavata]|uniref:Sulfatase-modifying factor enzyme domain-containing protein n=1 Tax=Thraustotheca clavata TaxID=74557 RepID=A0A1V9ZV21_9STRA|nr:hypothetical protein THRCLA_05694 [Thraustotheca clavata]